MKNLDNLNLQELSFEEQVNIDGGFPWGMFWSGMKVGLGVGGAIGLAAVQNYA